MDGRRFDTLIQSLGNRATRRGMLGVLAAAAALGVAETDARRRRGKARKQNVRASKSNRANKGNAGKVDICHRTGSGSYHLINVSANAEKAHLRHGDARPGDPVPDQEGKVFGDDCAIEDAPPTPETFCSGPLEFGPNGWGGWSCPAGMTAVGGSYEPADASVQVAEVAEPGTALYPNYPHHTFAPGETGFVVQNDNDGETITVCVECVPS
jgi:hypothetical protein